MRGICTFPGCTRELHGHGYCKTHRQQQRRGKPLTPIAPANGTIPIEERFWSKVMRTPHCWEWVGSMRPQGYGSFGIGGRNFYAHRLSWELTHGEAIPAGVYIDHICFNGRCVNPEHLRLTTPKLNCEYQRAGLRRDPESGRRGVYRNRDKWIARVVHNGVRFHLGSFDSKEEAGRAAAAKRRELFQFPEYQS